MWESKKSSREYNQPMIEVLEERQFMSVAAHPAVVVKHVAAPHAIVAPVKPAANAKAPAAPKPVKVAPAPKVVKAKPAPAPKVVAKAKPAPVTKNTQTSGPVVGDFPTFVPLTNSFTCPNVVGDWAGTMQLDTSAVASPFSVNIAFQRGVAASGAFNLGPTVDNQTVTSSMVFGTLRAVRVLIQNSTLWIGFSGNISANNQIISGRFAVNTNNGWKTGSFYLTRQ